MVAAGTLLSDAVYVLSSDVINAFDHKIVNLGTPTEDTDAATKAYVDSHAGGGGTITGVKMNGVVKGTEGVVDLGTVLTAHQSLTNYYTKSQTSSVAQLTTAFNNKATKATTLAGYGITDAKIASGVITLGSNSITPLTAHQSLDNYYTKIQVSSAS